MFRLLRRRIWCWLRTPDREQRTQNVFFEMEGSIKRTIQSGQACAEIAHALCTDWEEELPHVTKDRRWKSAFAVAKKSLQNSTLALAHYFKLTRTQTPKPELVVLERRAQRARHLCIECRAGMQMAEEGQCPSSLMLQQGQVNQATQPAFAERRNQ